jgi:hypothetical protein
MTMRMWLIVVLVAVFAASGFAANLNEGTKELSFDGNVELDTAAGDAYQVGVGLGYFVADFVEVGGAISYADDDVATDYDIGVFGEYNFDLGTPVVPYVGLALSYAKSEIDAFDAGGAEDQDAIVGTASAGVKYFLTEDLAIFGEARYAWATEDLYLNEDGELEEDNWDLNFGLRYYWD